MISTFLQTQPLLLSAHSLANEKHPCDVRCCRTEELENSISASTTRRHHFKEQRHRFALNQRQIFAVIKKGFFIFRQTYLPTSPVPNTIPQAFRKPEQTQPLLLFPCVSFVSARKRLPRHFLMLQAFFSHCYKTLFMMR